MARHNFNAFRHTGRNFSAHLGLNPVLVTFVNRTGLVVGAQECLVVRPANDIIVNIDGIDVGVTLRLYLRPISGVPMNVGSGVYAVIDGIKYSIIGFSSVGEDLIMLDMVDRSTINAK